MTFYIKNHTKHVVANWAQPSAQQRYFEMSIILIIVFRSLFVSILYNKTKTNTIIFTDQNRPILKSMQNKQTNQPETSDKQKSEIIQINTKNIYSLTTLPLPANR